jgi:magnesium transporter
MFAGGAPARAGAVGGVGIEQGAALRYAQEPVITSRIYRDGAFEKEVPFEPAAVEACRAAGDRRIWIDVVDPSLQELALVQRTLGLHELSVEDSTRWGQRPKVEFYPDYVFVVLHGLRLGAGDELVDSELHLFAGQKFYLLTIRREPLFEFPGAIARAGRTSAIAHEGIGFHLYLLLDEVVDDYLDVIDRLEDLADDVEERVFRDDGASDLQEDLFRLKRRVVRFRRAVAPMREVLDLLAEEGDIVTPPLAPYYRDVEDHVIRSIELTDNIRELLSSALETRLVQTSNRQNIVMKQLSAWAAIILIPTLVAGIYGMNFRRMPELDWWLGYPFALTVMGATALVLFRVFRRRDWL